MQDVKFPEIIDENYDAALEKQYKDDDFRAFYETVWALGKTEIMDVLNRDSAHYGYEIENAVTRAQSLTERVGFLVGFRYAVKLMQEVYA